MVSQQSHPESGSDRRQRLLGWLAVVSLLVIVLLVVFHPTLRTLPGDTWREIRTVNPGLILAIVALKVLQAFLSAVTWRNALRSAWPSADLPFGYVLGVDSGQDAVNTFSPARAGTWAMIGAFTLSIPGATVATMMAVWGVQSLAFWFFALMNYSVIAIGLPHRTESGESWNARLGSLWSERPSAVLVLSMLLVVIVAIAWRLGRKAITTARQQMLDGLAILHTPERYIRLIFLPSLVAWLARAASCALLLVAFDIPVTLWTVALALGSRAAAGAIRIAPGGVGTTQALEVIALGDYAPAEAVVAYSLVDLAISTFVSVAIAVPALLTSRRWQISVRRLKSGPS